MEKCCHRYDVFDNKAAVTGMKEGLKQEVNGGRKNDKGWEVQEVRQLGEGEESGSR